MPADRGPVPADRQASIDRRDSADMTEPTLAAEPTERMLPTEATDPIERIDPAEPMLRIDPAEPMDRIDPLDPMLRMEPVEPVSRCALPVIPMPRIISRTRVRSLLGCALEHGSSQGGTVDIDIRQCAHALEDLPAEVRQQAAEIAATQPGISLRQRVLDEIETAGLDLYGALEQAPLLHFLARYPVTPYTYQLTALVARGQRPDAKKLTDLAALGYRGTVNLCAEMDGGDRPAIAEAGLTGVLRTRHVSVTDMEPPTIAQVTEILDLLSQPEAGLTYVHCEAGKARTGVVIACYRMAVMGWNAAAALAEAVNFGCSVPGQQAFIAEFGELLLAGGPTAGRYPLLPPGSVMPTPAQLTATLAAVAASERDQS